ncbi:thermonuclease family protein [Candidatus Pelagibacter sp.]|nr:thermonuclease family protein [Candidatus Pelagibacter sp.]
MYLNKTNLFLTINIFLIFFFLTYNHVKSEEVKIISGLAKVTDGDTIRIDEKKIRFFGIDAPEKKQQCKKTWLSISFISFSKDYPCGQISTEKLKKKINNKFLICKWTNKDKYKRYIAECFKDKTNLNAWMVRNGYAVAYRKYSKKFVSQEISAKKDKIGLWSGTFMMPWDYRKNN